MDLSINQPAALRLRVSPGPIGWAREARDTLRLAWPLIIAQLAQIALFTTDVVMMGWLGPVFIGAGTLAVMFIHPFLLFGTGILSAVTPLVAQARGGGDLISVRRSVRQGFWVAAGVAALMTPFIWHVGAIFELLGQTPDISRLAGDYARAAASMFLPGLGLIVLRSLLSTHDDTKIILVVTLGGIVLNAACNYALMFGHWGFPRLELTGAGMSTTIVNAVMFIALLGYVLSRPLYRRYSLFVRFWKPDWPRLWRILRLGTPIGLLMMAEVGLFSVAGLLMGWLGTNELAAHAIALQLAAIAFMVPMGLSHATTVRVGLAYGARNPDGVRKAGWVSLSLGTGFMALTATIFWFFPEPLIALFLDPATPQNQISFALAVSYLGIAAMFQLADGAQVVAAAILRGLSDTAVPMVIGIASYWGIGLGLAYALGFIFELRGIGIWIGLAAGLAAVAITLSARFAFRDRLGLGLA
jgi:MATE family multidrug resistance protein